jgi:hypothetical protein
MKAKDVVVGATYMVKVSGKLAPVRLDRESVFGGWDGTNLVTGRPVRVRTAARLRMRAEHNRELVVGYMARRERRHPELQAERELAPATPAGPGSGPEER